MNNQFHIYSSKKYKIKLMKKTKGHKSTKKNNKDVKV